MMYLNDTLLTKTVPCTCPELDHTCNYICVDYLMKWGKGGGVVFTLHGAVSPLSP